MFDIRDQLVLVNVATMKGKRVIMPAALQPKTLEQLHSNNIDIEKKWLLARDSEY